MKVFGFAGGHGRDAPAVSLALEMAKSDQFQGKTGTVLLRLRWMLIGHIPLGFHVNRSKSVSLLPCREVANEIAEDQGYWCKTHRIGRGRPCSLGFRQRDGRRGRQERGRRKRAAAGVHSHPSPHPFDPSGFSAKPLIPKGARGTMFGFICPALRRLSSMASATKDVASPSMSYKRGRRVALPIHILRLLAPIRSGVS